MPCGPKTCCVLEDVHLYVLSVLPIDGFFMYGCALNNSIYLFLTLLLSSVITTDVRPGIVRNARDAIHLIYVLTVLL